MMTREKNVADLLIVGNVATSQTAGQPVNPSIMNALECTVTTPGGIVINAAGLPASPLFKIGAIQSNRTMKWSDTIDATQIKNIRAHRYAAVRNQIDYIGFNGVGGSIDPINNNLYTVRLYVTPRDKAGFMQQCIKHGVYKSAAGATEYDIANGVTNSLIANFSREHIKYARFAKVNSAAVTSFAIAGNVTNWTVTEGSAVTVSSQAHALGAAGTAVRLNLAGLAFDGVVVNATAVRLDSVWNFPSGVCIGHDTSVGLTADTTVAGVVTFSAAHLVPVNTKVYVGIANNGATVNTAVHYSGVSTGATTISLDRNYAGTANGACVVGGGQRAAGGNWGIRIQGVHYETDPPKFFFSIPYFETMLSDWGATTVTKNVIPFEGLGTLSSVRELEQQLQGSEGNFYRAQVPSPTFRADATNVAGYAMITIEYVDNMATDLGISAISHKQLYIACARPCTGTAIVGDANRSLANTLDNLITTWRIPVTVITNIVTEIAA